MLSRRLAYDLLVATDALLTFSRSIHHRIDVAAYRNLVGGQTSKLGDG